jgi:gamma-glutamyltranspeptidase / glutathione hydrolase
MHKQFFFLLTAMLLHLAASSQPTQKPPLHGRHWMAITGKPLAATAGAMIFQKGGNAVDAACAMLAATCTMWDVLSWGGETQALIYHPQLKQVIAINALGVAPAKATPDFFREKGMQAIPAYGPLAAVTPGTPGGLLTMLAEYGRLSLAEVLAPAISLADGYPIEAQTANQIEREKERIREWPYARKVFLVHEGQPREAPHAGEIFRQPELKATLLKLVEAEQQAIRAGKSRKEAIYAAYQRFYTGDIARDFVQGSQEQGGIISLEDLRTWQVKIEEPLMTSYRGIDVYKLDTWTQGPSMLQALNQLEYFDLKAMGYNSSRYIHTLYQVMNQVFADRDFYYGDPAFPPVEPIDGLLSKEYARQRIASINLLRNDPDVRPGNPYLFQKDTLNPFYGLLQQWHSVSKRDPDHGPGFFGGTTTVQATDADGWVVSITPSGGWVPACIAGTTGIGMSQRLQSFVLSPEDNPYNVLRPGQRPRVTLTPSLALKDGRPFLSFAVQGGDSQDQNLLQFFLNITEFGMTVQQACEAANFNSFQMRSSFGNHESKPGEILLREDVPAWVQGELQKMGYKIQTDDRTSGPINAIYFDWKHGSFWGGSSNHGEDYGISW